MVPRPVIASPSLGSRSTAHPDACPEPVLQFLGSPTAHACTRLGLLGIPAARMRLPTNSMYLPFGTVPVLAVQSAMLPAPVHCFGVSVPLTPYNGPWPPLVGASTNSQ